MGLCKWMDSGSAETCRSEDSFRRDSEVRTELENRSKRKVFAVECRHLLASLSKLARAGTVNCSAYLEIRSFHQVLMTQVWLFLRNPVSCL